MVTGEAKEQVRHRGETAAHVAVEACGRFLPVASILFPGNKGRMEKEELKV